MNLSKEECQPLINQATKNAREDCAKAVERFAETLAFSTWNNNPTEKQRLISMGKMFADEAIRIINKREELQESFPLK